MHKIIKAANIGLHKTLELLPLRFSPREKKRIKVGIYTIALYTFYFFAKLYKYMPTIFV